MLNEFIILSKKFSHFEVIFHNLFWKTKDCYTAFKIIFILLLIYLFVFEERITKSNKLSEA